MKRSVYKEFFAVKVLMLVFVAAALLIPSAAYSGGWKMIASERVYDMVKEGSGLWLIDVRSAHSFGVGHIEGSINITSMELKAKRFKKNKMLVLADTSLGLRNAKEAAVILVKKGQENVFVLDGGIGAWEEAGLPVAGKSPREASRRLTVRELRWATENKIPFTLYDLRGAEENKKGKIAGSEVVGGKDLKERMKSLRKVLEGGKSKGLAGMLESPKASVVVLPMGVNAEAVFNESLWGVKGDVRYLEGGFMAWQSMASTMKGACPTCNAGKREVKK